MVRKKKLIGLLLLLMLISYNSGENKTSFDYLTVVLVWPNAYCNQQFTRCKTPVPQNFKIHGLWRPFDQNHKHGLRPCINNYEFSKAEVANWNFSNILPLLFPNLKSGRSSLDFWEREWIQHGVCTDMSPENYFYSIIQYAIKYENLYSLLLQSGVTFPSNQPYIRGVLHEEIKKALGTSPMLKCTTYIHATQLKEVRVCINSSGAPINCPLDFFNCGHRETVILFAKEETISQFNQSKKQILSTIQKIKNATRNIVN